MSKKKVYSLNLTQEVMEAIKVQAVREGISVSDRVNRILYCYVEGSLIFIHKGNIDIDKDYSGSSKIPEGTYKLPPPNTTGHSEAIPSILLPLASTPFPDQETQQ